MSTPGNPVLTDGDDTQQPVSSHRRVRSGQRPLSAHRLASRSLTDSKWVCAIAIASALVTAATWGCRPPEPAEGAAVDPAAGSEAGPRGRIINVEVLRVKPSEFVEIIRLTAVAAANRDAVIGTQEEGRVLEIIASEGSWVSEGEALLKIDDEVLAAQTEQARSASTLATETWERRRRLFEVDSVGSEIDYLSAKYAAEQAAATYRSLRARLDRTTVRAPFAGIVEERFTEVGESLAKNQPVYRVVDLQEAKILAGVPERYALDVNPGDEARVTFDVLESSFAARIARVGATVDPSNRTFQVEIRVPNRGGRIKPEMVANVEIVRRRLVDAIVVPQDVVVRMEDGYIVYVVEELDDGTPVAQARKVSLGPAQQNVVVIEEGIAMGDRLVVVGHRSVAGGDAIRVVGERN